MATSQPRGIQARRKDDEIGRLELEEFRSGRDKTRIGPVEPWLFTAKGKTRGVRNIKWCEAYLRIPEGKHVGESLALPKFMQEDFRLIYDNPKGTRSAIISRGR